jgi:hypothetical protein
MNKKKLIFMILATFYVILLYTVIVLFNHLNKTYERGFNDGQKALKDSVIIENNKIITTKNK